MLNGGFLPFGQCHIRLTSSTQVASINTASGDSQGKVYFTINGNLRVHGDSSFDALHISGTSKCHHHCGARSPQTEGEDFEKGEATKEACCTNT